MDTPVSRLNRRDFLKLALMTGGAVTLAPFLNSCGLSTPTAIPTASATLQTTKLLDGLDGLEIDDFFEQAYQRLLLRDPEVLTEVGLADMFGVGDGNLTNISDTYIHETQALEAGILELLRKYDSNEFTADQVLTANVFDWHLDNQVRGHAYMYNDYIVNPIITSIHYQIYRLFTEVQPVNNYQDAQDYISRLSQVDTKLAQLQEGLENRKAMGVILPAPFIPIVQSDLNRMTGDNPKASPYYTVFAEKLGNINDLTAADKTALLTKAETAIAESVIPAYQDLAAYFEGIRPAAPNKIGVWQFPNGEAYYDFVLRGLTTTDSSADEIHELGKQNVERIHAEMRELFGALGYPTDESIPNLFARLTIDSGVYQGQETVDAFESAIQYAEQRSAEVFELFPAAEVVVQGGQMGDFYTSPAVDGSRPGFFYARTSGTKPKYEVPTLAFHETVPGHHFQIALALELEQPSLRKGLGFTAFAEGWALYAERLMWELGAYENDVPGNLGRLQAEVFRAARLVIDTNIHTGQWTFDKAADYLVQTTGYTMDTAQREVTRYSVWPGQAVSYYLGFMNILKLRQKAMDALGVEFALKDFHRVVIGSGSLPLAVLAQKVDAYIQAS